MFAFTFAEKMHLFPALLWFGLDLTINGHLPELQHCGKDVSKFSPLLRKPSLAVAMPTGKYNPQ